MIPEQIDIEPKEFLDGLRQRNLMSDKEFNAISNNIVDLPPLKCVPFCFVEKRFCTKGVKNRMPDPAQDDDLIANLENFPDDIQKYYRKKIKDALKAWNYYLSFRNANLSHRENKQTRLIIWKIKKANFNYTEKDILKASLIKGVRLSVKNREMIGIVTKDAKKFRYLLDKPMVTK